MVGIHFEVEAVTNAALVRMSVNLHTRKRKSILASRLQDWCNRTEESLRTYKDTRNASQRCFLASRIIHNYQLREVVPNCCAVHSMFRQSGLWL